MGQRGWSGASVVVRKLGRAAAWLSLAAVLLALGACNVPGIQQGSGGLPADLQARLSLVVAQTRSQFPDLSATGLRYDLRKAPADAPAPELALRGRGVGVEPGLQGRTRPILAAALVLAKDTYGTGYLEVTPTGEKAQRWPIVAFQLSGSPNRNFEFHYLLTTPQGALRYLVLIGGRYKEGELEYHGFEGTVVEPGPGNDLERWQRAWKLEFGFRFPMEPPHHAKVLRADALFRELQDSLKQLGKLGDRIAAAEGELATLEAAPVPPAGAPGGAPPSPEQAARRERELADVRQRLPALRSERDALAAGTEERFVRYYALRGEIAAEYHAFTESNAYLWLDRKGKQSAYDAWKVVEFHHPRVDELVSEFLAFKDHGGRVLDARAAAMALVNQHDNWSRDPSKSETKRPR